MERRDKIYQQPLVWLWGLFTLTIIIMFAGMPRCYDDFWFSAYIRPLPSERMPEGSVWEQIVKTCSYHFYYDTSRLANYIYIPFLLFPKWVGSIPCAIMFGYALFKGVKICADGVRWFPSALCMVLIAFFLPWYDCMGSEAFQFNYAVPTFLSVLCIDIFLKSERYRKGYQVLLILILGVITGAMHEGFTVPLIGGLVICFVLHKKMRTFPNAMMLSGLALGLVWLLASPAFFNRMGTKESLLNLGHLIFVTICHPCVLLALVLMIGSFFKRGLKRVLSDKITIILLVSMGISLVIHFVATRTPRTGFWAEIAAVLLICRIVAYVKDSALIKIFSAVLIFAAFVHQGFMDYYSLQIRQDFNKSLKLFQEDRDSAVFIDYTTEHEAPIIAWFAPDFNLFTSYMSRYFVREYFYPDSQKDFRVVPESLRFVTPTSGELLKGDIGARTLDGHLFVPLTPELSVKLLEVNNDLPENKKMVSDDITKYSGEFSSAIDYGFLTHNNVRTFFIPFRSDSDGKDYLYIYPWREIIFYRISRPCGISISPQQ